MRQTRSETELTKILPDFAAALFRNCLGDEAFGVLAKCSDQDRLAQLLTIVKIGGTVVGRGFEQTKGRVWQNDAVAITRDLLSLYDRQARDGPPAWLTPRGKKRSGLAEAEHNRRAVVWQRFIALARDNPTTGIDEVADLYGVNSKTVRNWMNKCADDPTMKYRLDQAAGFLKEDTGERIAAIFEDTLIRIVWMKQCNEHGGRGKPGHYFELLTTQANEYRKLKKRENFSR